MAENMTPIILRITDFFERLGVPYLIGGSIASMIHGVIRMTLDTDIVADLREDQVEAFAGALADEFYLDAESIHDAIRRRRCFNVIHLATMIKIDIFIPSRLPAALTMNCTKRPLRSSGHTNSSMLSSCH